MVHIHKKIRHHLTKHRARFGALAALLVGVGIIVSGTFFITRENNPSLSELAFTEHSSISIGSVIPASCESNPNVANGDGNYSGCATVTCWNGAVIMPAAGESCPPVTCSTQYVPQTSTDGCYVTTWTTTVTTCSDGTGSQSNSPSSTTNVCPPPDACATMDTSLYCPSQSCTTTTGVVRYGTKDCSVTPNACDTANPADFCPTQSCTTSSGVVKYGTKDCSTITPPTTPVIPSGCGAGTLNDTCPPPPPVLTAYISQTSRETIAGESFTITWDSDLAASCTVTYTGPDGGGTIVTPGTTTESKRASRSGSKIISLVPLGSYRFTNVCTDSGGDSATRSITHDVVAPDLTATTVTPIAAGTGANTRFSAKVQNIGTGDTEVGFSNFTQIASEVDGGGTITDLAPISVRALDGGKDQDHRTQYTFTTAGAYSMRVCADKSDSDSSGVITEDNLTGDAEDNNCGQWTNICVGSSTECNLNPLVVDVEIIGNNSSPGTLSFSCTNATKYSIVRTEGSGGGFPQNNKNYTGPVSKELTLEGNYTVTCTNGALSDSDSVFYSPDPLVTAPTFSAIPRSVQAGGVSTVSWIISNPPQGASRCTITAAAVCAGGTCVSPRDAGRTSNATSLTTQLSTGTTDSNDPYGPNRTMVTALTKPTSRAFGKKTMVLQYTTDFSLTCGSVIKKVRVQVSNENEG